MGSKRKSTNDIWLESGPRAKQQRTVLSHARTTVRRSLGTTPQLSLKRDSSLTQMHWLHKTVSTQEDPAVSSDDETETEQQAHNEQRKATKKVRPTASDPGSDEDYRHPGLRVTQKRESRTPGSSAKRGGSKPTKLPAQRTTVTQLGYGRPTRLAQQDSGVWEQDWDTQIQSPYQPQAEQSEDSTASPSGSVKDGETQQAPIEGGLPVSKFAEEVLQSSIRTSPTACSTNKKPYQTKTPRKRVKYEIGSSQSPSSPETGRRSLSFKIWKSPGPSPSEPSHGTGAVPHVDLPQRTPLLEKCINIKGEGSTLQHKEDLEQLVTSAEGKGVKSKDCLRRNDSQSEVMKLLESSRLRRLQVQRDCMTTNSFNCAAKQQITRSSTNDVDELRAVTLHRVSTIQDSQSSVSVSPTMVHMHDAMEDEETTGSLDSGVDAYDMDDGNEELPGTYDPAYSALDRDAARAFQTQTQMIANDKVPFSQSEGPYPEDENEKQETHKTPTAVDLARSQEQESPALLNRRRTLSPSSNVCLVEIEDSEDEEAFPSDPNELFDDNILSATHGLREETSEEDMEAIVPSTPPTMLAAAGNPVRNICIETELPIALDSVPITPSKLHPSQISTVVPSQPSPNGKLKQDSRNFASTPWKTIPLQTQSDATKMTSMSSPLPLPPWTPHGSHQHHSHPRRPVYRDSVEHARDNSSITLDSLADFSLLPPPSQLNSTCRPYSSAL